MSEEPQVRYEGKRSKSRTSKSRSRSRSPKARSRSPKARSRSPKARSRSPKARSRSPKARSRSPKARSSRSPKARSRSPRAKSGSRSNSRSKSPNKDNKLLRDIKKTGLRDDDPHKIRIGGIKEARVGETDLWNWFSDRVKCEKINMERHCAILTVANREACVKAIELCEKEEPWGRDVYARFEPPPKRSRSPRRRSRSDDRGRGRQRSRGGDDRKYGRRPLECFICKSTSHKARSCPERSHRDNYRDRSSIRCYECGQYGHISRQCPLNRDGRMRKDRDRDRRGSLRCYECGRLGHIARNCPGKYAPRSNSRSYSDSPRRRSR